MSACYSVRFCLANGSEDTYVVPAGKRAVVKGVTAANPTPSAANVYLYIGTRLVLNLTIPAGTGAALGGQMVVLNAGETLKVLPSPSTVAQASGFLLDAS